MRVLTEGWESGDFGLADTTSASTNYTNTVVAATGRPGAYCYRAARSAATNGAGCYVQYQYDASGGNINHTQGPTDYRRAWMRANTAGDEFCHRFYVTFTDLPATYGGGFYLARYFGASSENVGNVFLQSAGLQMQGATGVQTDLGVLPTEGNTYRIETRFRAHTGTAGIMETTVYDEDDWEVSLGGGSSLYSVSSSCGLEFLRVGAIAIVTISIGTGTLQFDFDDQGGNMYVANRNINNGYVGPGSVISYMPTAGDGSPQFTAWTGTYADVDDALPWGVDTANYIEPTAVAGTEKESLGFASFGETGNIRAIQILCYQSDSPGQDGASHLIGIVDSGGNEIVGSGSLRAVAGSDPNMYHGLAIDGLGSSGSTAWTVSEFDNANCEMFLNRSGSLNSTQKRVYAMMMQVENDQNLGLTSPHDRSIRRPIGQVI